MMKSIQHGQLFMQKLFLSLCMAALGISNIAFAQITHNYDCQTEEPKVINAARNGKLQVLQDHHKAGCTLPKQDLRGFTLYDLAALNSDEDTMDWLVSIGYNKEGQYSPRLYKLVQTGLRFLNFDAGVIDGKMNAATKEGIIEFQKDNKLKQTGEVSPEWLAFFDRKLVKKVQIVMENLGYSSGGADGIIGPSTRTAMQAFRQERSMPAQNYGYLDDQLLYQIMMAENEATKQEIARREAERAARIKAQQAAAQQEIAKRRAQAQKEAARAREQAEAAAKKAEAQRIAKEQALREEQQSLANPSRLIVKQGSPDEKSTSNITAQPATTRPQSPANNTNTKAQAEEQARRLAQAEAESAKRAAIEKRREEEIAEQKAQAARRAEERAKAQALVAEREAAKAKTQAELAFKAARSGKPVTVSPDVQVGQPIQSTSSTNPVKAGSSRFNELTGKLKFVREGQQLSQCFIAGQAIDTSWCEPYYPSGENKQCEAVISRTGIVVSLLCK